METDIIKENNSKDLPVGIQLMGDFARFIQDAIFSDETTYLEEARRYVTLFDDLFLKSKQIESDEQLNQLTNETFQKVQEFRKFILQILRDIISNKININLDPVNLNMMVNTTEIGLDGLYSYMHNSLPDTSTLASKWLQNMYVTTLNIQQKLGDLYFAEKSKAQKFEDDFLHLYNKSLILDGLRRTGIRNFPALNQFHIQIQQEMVLYAEYLVDLINLITKKQTIGMLTLLDVDSIYRRACFFTTKLSMISKIRTPVCDPASPRME